MSSFTATKTKPNVMFEFTVRDDGSQVGGLKINVPGIY